MISFNFSSLIFLFVDKKPKNENSFASIPEDIMAVISAHGPGIGITLIPSPNAILTISSPGSDITGVPASETIAIFLPIIYFFYYLSCLCIRTVSMITN